MEAPSLKNIEHVVDIRAASSSSFNYSEMPRGLALCVNSLEFITTLAKIIAAIVILKRTKGDFSEERWIIAYVCACFINLPILCWRFKHDPNSDILGPSRMSSVMSSSKRIVDMFFAVWTVAFFFVLIFSSSDLDHSSQLFWLCVAFLIIGCIRYVIPSIVAIGMCCCVASIVLCFGAGKKTSEVN